MAKAYCLTIEVKSPHIENGLGYMVTFVSPDGKDPRQSPDFPAWSQRIAKAAMDAGDAPFNPDPYTKKLAIAGLMHELDHINKDFALQIGFVANTAAVAIHSSNPADRRVFIDFSDRDGNFTVQEKDIAGMPAGSIGGHGKIGLIEAGADRFPFEKPAAPPAGHAPPSTPYSRSFPG